MKLLHEIIVRRLDVMKDLDLNHEDLKAIWHFYQIYKLCKNFLGIEDQNMKEKNQLLRKLILNPENMGVLNRLRNFMAQDNQMIEITLNSILEKDEIVEIFEDFYPDSVFAVNIDDRGN